MRKIFLFLTWLFAINLIHAQTVENIRVKIEEDQILIHYRIGASTEMQVFNVTLSCSMNGGPRFEPKSVVGDVGQSILGGKSNYTIIWDIFEDLNEIGDAEFFIKVDLDRVVPSPIKDEVNTQQESTDESIGKMNPFKKSTFIGFNGSTYSLYGLSAGSLNKYGFFGSIRSGTNNDEFQTDIWVTLVAGFTLYAFTREIYRMHGYAGFGSSIEHFEDLELNTSWTSPMIVAEAGMIHVIGRISLTTGIAYVNGYGIHLVYGVGFMF